jgi:hypothetical protein
MNPSNLETSQIAERLRAPVVRQIARAPTSNNNATTQKGLISPKMAPGDKKVA